jgi:hypothetical protein
MIERSVKGGEVMGDNAVWAENNVAFGLEGVRWKTVLGQEGPKDAAQMTKHLRRKLYGPRDLHFVWQNILYDKSISRGPYKFVPDPYHAALHLVEPRCLINRGSSQKFRVPHQRPQILLG